MWEKHKIGDLGNVIGGATPSTKDEDNYNGEIPWITPKDLSNHKNRYIERGERSISQKGYRSCSSQIVPAGTVLFSSRAPIGYVAIAKNELCTNQGFKSVVPNEKVDSMFLYYLLLYNRDMIASKGSGTTFKEVSGSVMREIAVLVPSLSEQRAIATILSCLDDKIELNNKINANLEAQAQAIFESWFVDFEPFRDGEFVDSELGPIPKGFELRPLYDFAEYINGSAFTKDDYAMLGTPIIKIAELKNGITDSTQYCRVDKEQKYYIQNKELLFSWSGNPETSIDTFIWCGGVAILNQHIFRVIPYGNTYSFVYCLLRYFKPEFTRIASNKQTTGLGHVTIADLKRLSFVYSTKSIDEFCRLITPFTEMIYNNMSENSTLSALRDILLPKLMSGEIEVPIELQEV